MSSIFLVNMYYKKGRTKKGSKISNAFQKNLDESNGKSSKTWEDKDSEFYNRSVNSWLQDNHLEIHPMHNTGKNVAAERFIRTYK